MHSPEETAFLIALLFKRSEQKRARLSSVTIKKLAKRRRLRGAFLDWLIGCLDGLGLILIELERGGYGLLPSSALDGAPAITAKKLLQNELRKKAIDFDSVRSELGYDVDSAEEEE